LGTNPLSEREFRVLNDLYDAELSLISRTIGDLVRGLETRSLLDDTLVIITSDHGENIGDHNHLDHVFSLHDSVLHVPLILLDPDVEVGRREDSLATSVDVFQTALAAARSEYTAERSTGRNLLAPSVSGTPRAHVAEYYYPEQVMSVFGNSLDERGMNRIRRYLRRIRSIQTDEWKLIWGSDGNHLLFDVRNDPGEALDLADDEPEQVVALTRLLEEQLGELRGGPFSLDEESIRIDEKASDGGGGFQDLDDEARERLKTLGYVE
jgi:arylsulfatase A-like enzyme